MPRPLVRLAADLAVDMTLARSLRPAYSLSITMAALSATSVAQSGQVAPEIYRPIPLCDTSDYYEMYVCPPVPMTQGQRCSDHAGLSLDAGGDWNGDGILDVVIGGGGKIDAFEQSATKDTLFGGVRVVMRGIQNTLTIDDVCPNDPLGASIGQREELPRTIRIEGEQVRGLPHLPDSTPGVPVQGGQMYADRFGWTVRFVGDVLDESGSVMDEIAIGAPFFDQEDSGPPDPLFDVGAVYLFQFEEPDSYTGVTGDHEVRLHPNGFGAESCVVPPAGGTDYDYTLRIEGSKMGALFGFAICDEVDFDGDGIQDLVVGAPAYPARQILQESHPWSDDNIPGEVFFIPDASLRALLQAVPPIHEVVVDDIANVRVVSAPARHRFGASLVCLGPVDAVGGMKS